MAGHYNVTAIYFFNEETPKRKMPTKTQKSIVIGAIIFLTILFLADSYYWAQLSQWREDQSANLWLGYTRGPSHIPVGLISSRKLPNPNGMLLLGFFLSVLPSLLAVSFFLRVTQIILVVLVGWRAFAKSWQYFLLATIPSVSSVILRSTSVEFWNQNTITLLNIFFLFWAIQYLKNASLWNIPPITILILLAPSLYLAGIVNAIVMTLLTIAIMAYKRPDQSKFWTVFGIVLLFIGLSIVVTWRPYFHNVSLEQVLHYSRIQADPISSLPLAFKHADLRILSLPTQILLKIVDNSCILQVAFAFTTFSYLFFAAFFKRASLKYSDLNRNSSLTQIVVLCGSFIILSYALSAWLGGSDWLNNQRADQTVQFLPMVLLFVFLLPFSIQVSGKANTIITRLSFISLAVFAIVNLFSGFLIIRDHLQYRGNVLTEADVPLINKMQAIDFIANDWKSHSGSNIIPVDYDLGGGKWDWVPQFGLKLTKWYPAPLTIGRSFDYELLRHYDLTNEQEGIQRRTFGSGRYLVTYAFEAPPQIENRQITQYIFGRLRVSIVDK